MDDGALAGVIIGSFLAFVVLMGLIYYFCR